MLFNISESDWSLDIFPNVFLKSIVAKKKKKIKALLLELWRKESISTEIIQKSR